MTAGCRVTVVTDRAGFEALAPEWNRLADADPRATVYQRWEINYHCWRLRAGAVAPMIVVVRRSDGTLAGVLPLGIERRRIGPFTLRRLGPAAPWQTSHFGAVAAADAGDEVLGAMDGWLRESARSWDEFAVQPLRQDSWLASGAGRFAARASRRRIGTSHFVNLTGVAAWQDLLGHQTARRLDRKIRQVEREHGLTLRTAATPPERARVVEALARMHTSRWGARGPVAAPYGDAAGRGALLDLVEAMAAAGAVRLHYLGHEERVAAAYLAWAWRGEAWGYRTAYDPAVAGVSPGLLVLIHAVRGALAEGLTQFDMGFGDQAYKAHWTSGERTAEQAVILRRTAARLGAGVWDWCFPDGVRARLRGGRSPGRVSAAPSAAPEAGGQAPHATAEPEAIELPE
jgi:CelD/BcsL family acetyltransferase involved in cellulose biosynthesis